MTSGSQKGNVVHCFVCKGNLGIVALVTLSQCDFAIEFTTITIF